MSVTAGKQESYWKLIHSPAAHRGQSLPMGWTYWLNVCNIHGGGHLALRYRAMLQPGAFFKFGTLPALQNLSTGGSLSFYNFWQVAKISWHTANSTPTDPPWFWIVPHIAPVTKNGPEKHIFMDIWPLTYDPDWQKRVKPYPRPSFIPNFKPLGPLAAAVGSGTHIQKEGRKES